MSTPMTPAQAAQNNNRDQGGRYATKTHTEAQIDLGGYRPRGSQDASAPARNPRRRRASGIVALGATAVLALSMTGCSSNSTQYSESGDDYAQVCQDIQSGQRVEDEKCDDEGSGGHAGSHSWFFMSLNGGRTVPAVGSVIDRGAGSTTRPTTGTSSKVSSAGGSFAKSGTVSSGGFGGKGGGAGS